MTARLLLPSYLSQRLPHAANDLTSFTFLLTRLLGFGFNATGRKGPSGGIPAARCFMLSPLAIWENTLLLLAPTVAASRITFAKPLAG